MPILAVKTFLGALPKISDRLLSPEYAANAVNCDLAHGTLKAMQEPSFTQKTATPATTIFKHATDGWLTWNTQVSVVKSAVVDVGGEKPLGQLLLTGERDYPTMYLSGGSVYRLGIPRPLAALTANVMAEAALLDVDAWAWAAVDLGAAPARYGYEGATIVADSGVRVSPIAGASLESLNIYNEPEPVMLASTYEQEVSTAQVSSDFYLTVRMSDSGMVSVIVSGALSPPYAVEYYDGTWNMASFLTIQAANAFSFSAPTATRVRITNSLGKAVEGFIDGSSGGTGNNNGTGNDNDNESEQIFSRSATLENKAAQMNDTAVDGRTDWTSDEVAKMIGEAGFSVEEWWEAFGKAESVCPWDSPASCQLAGYDYHSGRSYKNIGRSSSYCYTFVQSLANGVIQYESAPSPPTRVVDVPKGDGVILSGFRIPVLPDLKITHVRIYRTVAGLESSEFHFVIELTIQELAASGWKYIDVLHDKDISSEVLQTSDWDPIPNNAKGLIKTDNGMYAAFRGNELLISEPFCPYAFPVGYALTVEDMIVALAHVDGTIVVLTTGRPYLAQGAVPESLQLIHLPFEQACVSAKSVATLPGAVVYASPDGLMYFTSNQQTLVTEKTYSRDQWQALTPSRLMGRVHDGRYVAFFEGTNRGIIFHIDQAYIVEITLPEDFKVNTIYHHSEDDALYLGVSTSSGHGIWQFEAGSKPLPYTWRSKSFYTSSLCCMAAARIEGEQNARDSVRLTVFGPDGKRPRATMRVVDSRTKRLPTTRSERLWCFELKGTATVHEARLASGVEELEYGGA